MEDGYAAQGADKRTVACVIRSAPMLVESDASERATVSLFDVADLNCLPPAEAKQIGALDIAVLAAAKSVRVRRGELRDLAEARVPGVAFSCGDDDACAETVPVSARSALDRNITVCRETIDPIAAGVSLTTANTRIADCGKDVAAGPLIFDAASEEITARADLAPGTALGRVAVSDPPYAKAGDRLVASARIGPVTVSRPVTALQPARRGSDVFVRSEDGTVFAMPVASVEPAAEAQP